MNKAFDLNKYLLGKPMKKREAELKELKEWYAEIKYDGHYTTVVKYLGEAKYYTSSGKEYTPANTTWLDNIYVPQGVYMCERIEGDGKLGARTGVALYGPTNKKKASASNRYIAHDYVSLDVFHGNGTASPYEHRRLRLLDIMSNTGNLDNLAAGKLLPMTLVEAENYLEQVVARGYEGIMLKHKSWVWEDTKSRTTKFMKWKKRPTADLVCIRTEPGEGKYEGMIGSLVLMDYENNITVRVGSGLSDEDRSRDPSYFIHKVIEIEYEQIIDTYIQPTFITIREDK